MNDATDIPSKIENHCEEGSEVEHDVKEELRFFHPEEGLKKNEVTGATDGKKLRQPLNDSQQDGLRDINRCLRKNFPSLGACLREAASAKAGEGMKGRGKAWLIHPHPNPPPSRGRGIG
jgi:hypothetical protein